MLFPGWELPAYLAAGALSGLLAGLLGIGGGLVLVPALLMLLPLAGVPADWLMHVALGSSLGAIVLTSVASARAHAARDGIDWQRVRQLSPGLLIGAVAAGHFAGALRSSQLSVLFLVFALVMAWRLWRAPAVKVVATLPPAPAWWGFGGIIGVISGLVGIGGGSLTVPLLLHYGQPMARAVGTSAACGLPIAVAGTLGYLWAGWGVLPLGGAAGFVYLPAVLAITVAAWITAPFGAKLAHRWPAARLKKIFALFLLLVAAKLLWSVAV